MMQILDFCTEAKTFQEILDFIGLKDKVNFKKTYIDPMIKTDRLRMTLPDNPTNRNQKYITVKNK